MRIKIIIILLMTFFVFALISCSSPTIQIKLFAQPHLNPDHKHRSLPVLIRIYQLSQIEPFESATFHQLWENDKQMLGSTLVNRQEMIIPPNSHLHVQVIPLKNAHYLAVVALFRKPEHSQWRILKPMPTHLSVAMENIRITLAGNKIGFLKD